MLFCLSPSFSLSFVSFSMTPNRKSTLARNPLRSGAASFSSPSDSTPSDVQFCDDKARKDFSKNFSQRGIHSKCQVILSDFFNIDLPTIIYSRGWESLCSIPVTCLFVIIQEFYSNMHKFNYSICHFVTRVRGTRIVVTLNIVFEVLHVPRVAYLDYLSRNHLKTVSKDELSSLFYETPSS